MAGRLDLKKTVNLPTAEPKMLDRWNSENVYAKIRAARSGRPMRHIQNRGR